ncbi:hypothetical protein BGZ61DRAFT_442341 [Ilyonectria robusta]|uniref:uncharacterized protein n=1 Tax=Ilyonectria robusta TaxID=1079257 RepID=UPI001E8CF183|nr:uncharacterized protein BGZ61DRAFT_442341 [Ilyonectria robusta]KAH8734276.1 hypothetical protein BGZ61DRAFT_442341 [Ilyonectria robusta]
MQLLKFSAVLATVAQFTGVQANYETGKAVQINFYTNTQCSAYAGEMAFWQFRGGKHPYAGLTFSISDPDDGECWDFRQAGGTQSLNLAGCWDGSSTPHPWCSCSFWDDWGCKGNQKGIHTGSGNCLPGRSSDGWQWKSAKCWVDR